MGILVYPNGMGTDNPIWIDVSVGDIVTHKLTKERGILGKTYRKLNKCYVEWEDGTTSETHITSLEKSK